MPHIYLEHMALVWFIMSLQMESHTWAANTLHSKEPSVKFLNLEYLNKSYIDYYIFLKRVYCSWMWFVIA